jgi:hypothetical protein
LIKKQKEKDFCSLYITDCDSRIWIQKLDLAFFASLKEKMSINIEMISFCTHFIKNVKNSSKLKLENNNLEIEMEIVIGDGLEMNCSF